jgi:F-type H+-transporting ATPase subunit c
MKVLKVLFVALAVFALTATPVLAQTRGDFTKKEGDVIYTQPPDTSILSGASVGAGLGAAITIVGAGWGFGRIGAAALDGMARQPEVAPRIQTAMLIIAALLEGATFFALIVCIQVAGRTTGLLSRPAAAARRGRAAAAP